MSILYRSGFRESLDDAVSGAKFEIDNALEEGLCPAGISVDVAWYDEVEDTHMPRGHTAGKGCVCEPTTMYYEGAEILIHKQIQ